MDTLMRGGTVVGPHLGLIQMLRDALEKLLTPERVLEALENFVDNPTIDSEVAQLAADVGIDTEELVELLKKHETEIDLLLGKSLAELEGEVLSWPVDAEGSGTAGPVSLQGEADLEVAIAVDLDGEALDGAIGFDDQSEALTSFSVQGSASGQADASQPIGSIAASAFFGLEGEITLENFFLHDRSERALSALAQDIVSFRLPGGVHCARDVCHRRGSGGAIVLPRQWIRLAGEGKIDVGGSLSWGRSFVRSRRISSSSLDLDEPITVDTGLSASLSASYTMEGDFDLLVSASQEHPGWVSVRLSRRLGSTAGSSFSAGASVGVRGLDAVARKLLDQYLPKMNALVAKVEENVEAFGDLRKLLVDNLDDQLDRLLASTDLDDKLQGLLDTIVAQGDLRSWLERVARDRLLGLAEDEVAEIDAHLDTLRQALSNLVGEGRLDEIPQLRDLLRRALDRQLDDLLDGTQVDDQIDRWIAEIAEIGDLRETLKELAREAAIDLVGDHLDDLQAHLDTVRGAVKDLITKYRDTVAKIERAIGRAADLRIGVTFTRARQRMRQKGFDLRIEVDVEQHPELYRQMLRGSFDQAMRLAQSSAHLGIEISGTLSESAMLDLDSQLSVDIFGFGFNQGTILNQDWDATVSTSGDVAIAAEGQVAAVDSWWRGSKIFNFLADARVAALVAGDDGLSSVTASRRVSLELAREKWQPKRKKLRQYAESLEEIGVTEGVTTMVDDLIPPSGPSRPSSRLATSVLLELDSRHLDHILDAGLEQAQRVFVRSLIDLYAEFFEARRRRIDVRDATGRPLLLWPSVRHAHLPVDPHEGRVFASGEHSSALTAGDLKRVKSMSLLIDEFTRLIKRLGELRTLSSIETEEGRAAWLRIHKQMLKAVKGLVPKLSKRHRLGAALFRTLFVLANRNDDLDPYVVVTRDEDDQVFVYG